MVHVLDCGWDSVPAAAAVVAADYFSTFVGFRSNKQNSVSLTMGECTAVCEGIPGFREAHAS